MTELQQRIDVRSLRELDRLVAEHLFDWSDFWEWNGDGATDALGHQVNSGLVMGYSPEERSMGIDGERSEVWHYSTDIAAAWTIVEKVTNAPTPDEGQSWYFWLDRECTPPVSRFHHFAEFSLKAECELHGVTTASFQSLHESLPIAICLAALKTVGIEIEQEVSAD